MKLRIARFILVLAGLAAVPATALAVIAPSTPKVNPLAGPNKAVHDAQANLDLARKQLLVIRRKVESQFDARPEWKAAKAAKDKAKADYDAADRKVTARLEKSPDYKALEVKRDKAQAVLDQEMHPAAVASGDDPVKLTDEQINEASKERTDAGLAIREMQKSAEDSDPTLIDLRQKMQDTRAAWDDLEAQVDDALKLDPSYPQAELAVTQAEVQLEQARQSLAQAAQSQRQADQQALKARSKQ